jgi:HTH-type transcriptional regulator / antitoxin HigA
MKDVATETEYDQTIAEINRLLRKGEANLSPEEDRLLDLLSTLAENWKEVHHPIPEAPDYCILRHYMQVRGLRQIDLQPVLGSRGVTSKIVNGKRSITKEQSKRLAAFFGVSPAVLLIIGHLLVFNWQIAKLRLGYQLCVMGKQKRQMGNELVWRAYMDLRLIAYSA